MQTLADKIAEAIGKYHKGFMQKKVLRTVEEIEATTDPLDKYVAGAESVNELNNNLGGCSLEQDGEDFYIVGADAVRKKLCNISVDIYIRIRLQGEAPWKFTYIYVDVSYDGETWYNLLSNFRLSTGENGTAYHFAQDLQYTVITD